MNSIAIIGRLTREPQSTKSGESIVSKNTIACQRKFRDSSTGKYESDFFDVIAFGRTAEFMDKHFSKGSLIGIEGRLQQDRWKNKDGDNRSKVVIVVEDITFPEGYGKKGEAAESNPAPAPVRAEEPAPAKTETFMEIPDGIPEELPFSFS